MSNSIFVIEYSKTIKVKDGGNSFSQVRIGEFKMIGNQQKPIITFFAFPSAHSAIMEEIIENGGSLQDYYKKTDRFADFRKPEQIWTRYSTEDQVVGQYGWQPVISKEMVTMIDGNKLVKSHILSAVEPIVGMSWEQLGQIDPSRITKISIKVPEVPSAKPVKPPKK